MSSHQGSLSSVAAGCCSRVIRHLLSISRWDEGENRIAERYAGMYCISNKFLLRAFERALFPPFSCAILPPPSLPSGRYGKRKKKLICGRVLAKDSPPHSLRHPVSHKKKAKADKKLPIRHNSIKSQLKKKGRKKADLTFYRGAHFPPSPSTMQQRRRYVRSINLKTQGGANKFPSN